jgi:hypothetical protein
MALLNLRGHGDLLGHGPHAPHQLTGHGHDHLVGMFPSCDESSIALTQPDLRLPAEVLDGRGLFLESELQVSTHLGRLPVRPGAFDQGLPGMGIASLGEAPLAAALTGRIFRRNQSQELHELSGVATRVRSPSSATVVTATVHGTPRRA